MTPYKLDPTIERLYKEYRAAKRSLAALRTALEKIIATPSITTGEGYTMYSASGSQLRDTNYVRGEVAQYQAKRTQVEGLRKRLIELGERDPE
jgi:hypothetical protein